MLKMVDGTGIIGVDMICPLGGAVSPPQPPNYDNIEMEGVGSLMLPNSLKAPLERVELIGNSMQGENPSPDNPQEIKSAGWFDEASGKYLFDVKVTGKNLFDLKKIKKGFVTSTGNGFDIMESSVHPKSIYLDMVIPLKVGQTLNISGVEQDACRIRVKHDTGNYYLKYTANKDTEIIICFYSGLTDENKKTILIEISDTPTNYEPYTEQSVQIALDEPLRGVGEYKDTITKDGIVRKIAHEVGNTKCSFLDLDAEKNLYKVSFTPKYTPKTDKTYEIQCNISSGLRIYKDLALIYWLATSEEIQGIGIDIKGTMKDANAKLLEYLSKNPIELQYELETPVTEPLPESVQAQLQALHSENGTTHVFVDSGEVLCGIKLTYRKEK